jgi:hypothetical protein
MCLKSLPGQLTVAHCVAIGAAVWTCVVLADVTRGLAAALLATSAERCGNMRSQRLSCKSDCAAREYWALAQNKPVVEGLTKMREKFLPPDHVGITSCGDF